MAPTADPDEKRVHGFKAFIVIMESECVKPYPTFYREECLGRKAYWLSPPGLYILH